MNEPSRYRAQGTRETRAGVDWIAGLDPLTGLPVLIYEFEGEPLVGVGDLESENFPRPLWSGTEGATGKLVCALAPGWRRWRPEDGPLDPEKVVDAVRALRDAAALGLVHGDIHPARFLLARGRLLVEGYGVPWRPDSGTYLAPELVPGRRETGTLEADVWALAASLKSVGTTLADPTYSAVLEQALAEDPAQRPTAEEIYLALESLLPRSQSTQRATDTTQELVTGPTIAARNVPGETPDELEDSVGQEDRGVASSLTPASGGEEVSPRRNTPRPSPQTNRDDGRRRLVMLGVLMASVIILALLAKFGPRGDGRPAIVAQEATVYVIEVFVAPSDLPPVTIHLISSPPDSSLAGGDRLGTAPRQLALDRPGTWAFQGSLQDRRSEIVQIEVPEERSITLTLPPP